MKSLYLILIYSLLVILLLGSAHAQVSIDTVSVSPEKIFPGDEINLQITVDNVGDSTVDAILIRLELLNLPFAPVGSSTEKSIDTLRSHRRETVYYTLRSLPDTVPQIYKIPVTITHDALTTSSLIGVEVTANAQLEVLMDNFEGLSVDKSGTVKLKFVNNGLIPLQFLKVTLKESSLYDILSPPAVYIGDVAVGDFESEEFILIPKLADPILSLELEYRDANNHLFKESKLVQIKAYTLEQAQQLGLNGNTFSYLPIITLAVVLIVAFFIYTKIKKRKRNVL